MKTFVLLFVVVLYSCSDEASLKIADSKLPITGEEATSVIISPLQLPKKLIDDDAIYDLINSHIAADTAYSGNYKTIIGRNLLPAFFGRNDSLKIIKADSIFTKSDVYFIFKQARYSTSFSIDKTKLNKESYVLLPDTCDAFGAGHKEYWENIHNQFTNFTLISMPLFSIDRSTALLNLSHSCGPICGYGATYIYRKTDNKWKLLAIWDKWVS